MTKDELDILSGKYDEIKQDYTAVFEKYETANNNYETTLQQYTTSSKEYDKLQVDYSVLATEYAKVDGDYQAVKNEAERLNQLFDTLLADYNAAHDNYDEMLAEYQALSQSYAQLQNEYKQADANYQDTRSKEEALKLLISKFSQQYNTVDLLYSNALSQYTFLKNEYDKAVQEEQKIVQDHDTVKEAKEDAIALIAVNEAVVREFEEFLNNAPSNYPMTESMTPGAPTTEQEAFRAEYEQKKLAAQVAVEQINEAIATYQSALDKFNQEVSSAADDSPKSALKNDSSWATVQANFAQTVADADKWMYDNDIIYAENKEISDAVYTVSNYENKVNELAAKAQEYMNEVYNKRTEYKNSTDEVVDFINKLNEMAAGQVNSAGEPVATANIYQAVDANGDAVYPVEQIEEMYNKFIENIEKQREISEISGPVFTAESSQNLKGIEASITAAMKEADTALTFLKNKGVYENDGSDLYRFGFTKTREPMKSFFDNYKAASDLVGPKGEFNKTYFDIMDSNVGVVDEAFGESSLTYEEDIGGNYIGEPYRLPGGEVPPQFIYHWNHTFSMPSFKTIAPTYDVVRIGDIKVTLPTFQNKYENTMSIDYHAQFGGPELNEGVRVESKVPEEVPTEIEFVEPVEMVVSDTVQPVQEPGDIPTPKPIAAPSPAPDEIRGPSMAAIVTEKPSEEPVDVEKPTVVEDVLADSSKAPSELTEPEAPIVADPLPEAPLFDADSPSELSEEPKEPSNPTEPIEAPEDVEKWTPELEAPSTEQPSAPEAVETLDPLDTAQEPTDPETIDVTDPNKPVFVPEYPEEIENPKDTEDPKDEENPKDTEDSKDEENSKDGENPKDEQNSKDVGNPKNPGDSDGKGTLGLNTGKTSVNELEHLNMSNESNKLKKTSNQVKKEALPKTGETVDSSKTIIGFLAISLSSLLFWKRRKEEQ